MVASATRRLGHRLRELGNFLDSVMPVGSQERKEAFAIFKALRELHQAISKEEGARRIHANRSDGREE